MCGLDGCSAYEVGQIEMHTRIAIATTVVSPGAAARVEAVTLKIGKSLARHLRRTAVTKGHVWKLPGTQRGIAIEEFLADTHYKDWFHAGALDGGTFPLIDFQKGNTLVSLKSVDTRGRNWSYDMKKHINLLGGAHKVNGAAAMRVLDLRVQPGGAQAARDLILYGAQRNVIVTVSEF